ncbi:MULTISPECIES: NRAMP family divalent metal transporter [Kocuria]|uniref:NRAMP family divalent metal transporter n=1 Tax=Kocuria TaxID=57493 RepID=UPI00065F7BB7|nr:MULTISPECIES: NRAMP family divalent metal transporter [Kocuria]MCT1366861.1 divalent metal cation transporter [Rothia sp. p3-SID1597]RUQ20725.1 divalent metal cation transporter [Kocuria sp. HSID16901]
MGDVVTKQKLPKVESKRSILLGALFLMATSAIGPGFITQTATFTVQMGAAFAFAIFLSIIVDIAVQLNVWRVIGVSGLRAGELGNKILPGIGVILGIFVVFGGFVFNVGNVAGGGLGISAMTGLDPTWGGIITSVLAILVFLSKKAGVALDKIVVVLGVLMILITGYVAVISGPPVGDAFRQTVLPDNVDMVVVTTLIGGTVGGYITYAGAHRMIDAGVSGIEDVKAISGASITSIVVTGVMRYLLFLAILGVVAGGVALTSSNLAAEAFQHAAGDIGLRLFGVILWAASISSVIGAAYTSVSFMTTRHTKTWIRNLLTIVMIVLSSLVFMSLGKPPATLLVIAGTINGLILPLGFTVILIVAIFRRDLLQGYKYPKWLIVAGVFVWLLTLYFGVNAVQGLAKLWNG